MKSLWIYMLILIPTLAIKYHTTLNFWFHCSLLSQTWVLSQLNGVGHTYSNIPHILLPSGISTLWVWSLKQSLVSDGSVFQQFSSANIYGANESDDGHEQTPRDRNSRMFPEASWASSTQTVPFPALNPLLTANALFLRVVFVSPNSILYMCSPTGWHPQTKASWKERKNHLPPTVLLCHFSVTTIKPTYTTDITDWALNRALSGHGSHRLCGAVCVGGRVEEGRKNEQGCAW